ncbi:DUF1489 family protein [Pararhodobacter oceanensis]|uniref:DUF1489 domain-containing protein n=1 Tax=Pararhodobacter oceanensis TaxID=2172121 RepID=A0A2T8HX72_9RHOB|nr:DUF1489 domain-containing protein [Pararhodobacter oceanensis]PVH30021.1 DUF1489 domain-containing protein [Pararhodobacter oceanensis]
MTVHIIKLCVGAEGVDSLIDWQNSARSRGPDGLPRHVTRMTPKRAAEVLDGGSLYWVFKGQVLARQRILRLDEVVGEDGIKRCGFVFDPEIIRTEPAPRRPFQGWRYLNPEDAPRDLPQQRKGDDDLPQGMAEALAEFGLH